MTRSGMFGSLLFAALCEAGCSSTSPPGDAAPSSETEVPPSDVPDATLDARDADLRDANDADVSHDAMGDLTRDLADADVPGDVWMDVTAEASAPSCDTLVSRVGTPDPIASLDPPRPLTPASAARVSTPRPRLRWRLAPGADGASVEVCRERGCTGEVVRADVTGTEFVPTTPLGRGQGERT